MAEDLAALLDDRTLIKAIDRRSDAGADEVLRQQSAGEAVDLERAQDAGYAAMRAVLVEALGPWEVERRLLTERAARLAEQLTSLRGTLDAVSAERDLALKARDHYDEERRERYQELCGWQGRAEQAERERDEARRDAAVSKLAFDSANHLAAAAEARAEQAESALARLRGKLDAFRVALASYSPSYAIDVDVVKAELDRLLAGSGEKG